MNIEKLIEVAREIDAACEQQEAYTRSLQELAARARSERRSLTHEIPVQTTVFDLGDLVAKLRKALHEK